MAKHNRKAKESVEEAVHKHQRGEPKRGRTGKSAKGRRQAAAIGLEEGREKGAKVPPKKRSKKK